MTENLKYIEHEKYLETVYTGERSFAAINHLIKIVYDRCEKNQTQKILINVSEAKGKWQEFDRFFVAEKTASIFKGCYKILVIDNKDQINKFAENTANNRGLNLFVTDDRNSGVNWLLKTP